MFDPLKSYVKFDDQKLNNFNYHQIAFDSLKPNNKKFYLNNFLHASGSSLKGNSFKDKKYKFSRTLIASLINPFKKMVKVINVKTDNLDNFCKKKRLVILIFLKLIQREQRLMYYQVLRKC